VKRLSRVAEEEVLLVILLAGFAVVFLSIFPPHLFVNDTFLTLTAGREVAENGLPSRDELTVLGAGRPWTDQQWGAQLLAYGAYRVGEHALLAVLASACSLVAFVLAAVAARSLGAGARAFVVIFFPVIFAASWAWTIRAQVFALPFFIALVWLLMSESRRPSRAAYLALPLLVVWANLHGSVALGALLTMLFAAIELVSTRGRSAARSALIFVLAPLMVLATPYGPVETGRYYRLMLVDPPFGDQLTEWQWSEPDWNTLAFYALAAVAVALVIWGRRRLRPFDIALLGVTFVGGVQALRGIQWFALACLIVLPVAIGRTLEGRAAPIRRGLNWALTAGAIAVLAVVVTISFLRGSSWYERNWPNEAIPAVREGASLPNSRVFATDRHADWLLWKLPELRGRVAYDVRFEIYEPSFFDDLTTYNGQKDGWKQLASGYAVVVVDEEASRSHTEDFLAEPGSRALYEDELIAVVLRQAES
jgi:hypothetical protein